MKNLRRLLFGLAILFGAATLITTDLAYAQSGPVLTSSVKTAARGYTVGLLASGFRPHERVVWELKPPSASAYKLLSQTTVASEADDQGLVSNGFGVAHDGESGTYWIRIRGVASGDAAISVMVTQEVATVGKEPAVRPEPLQTLPSMEKPAAPVQSAPTKIVPGMVGIKIKPGANLGAILARHGHKDGDARLFFFDSQNPNRPFDDTAKAVGLDRWYLLTVAESTEAMKRGELQRDADIEAVTLFSADLRSSYTPTDPLWPQQWAHQKIKTPDAWDIRQGPGARVAVIDTGVDGLHGDLWGLVDGGWDFRSNTAIAANVDSDFDGHGTAVAGVIAPWANNGMGVAGVAFGTHIVPYVHQYESQTINAIYRAIADGVRIINMSFEGYPYNPLFMDAVDYAWNNGATLVAATGNTNTTDVTYPAGYQHVIAVTATDQNDNRPSFARYGGWVNMAAPGVSILTTWPNARQPFPGQDWVSINGTSFSAPAVAAVAALFNVTPGHGTQYHDAYYAVQETTDALPGSWTIPPVNGRLNAARAVALRIFSGFEPDQNRGLVNTMYYGWNVTGYSPSSPPELGARSYEFGVNPIRPSYMEMMAGTANQSYAVAYFKLYDALALGNWTIRPGDHLRYHTYFYQQNTMAVDLEFTDGTNLRDLGKVDQNGVSVHPAQRYVYPTGQWLYFDVDLSSLAGKRIKTVMVAYDNGNTHTTGQFRGYVDQLKIGY